MVRGFPKNLNEKSVYVIDSNPVAVCDKAYNAYTIEDGMHEAGVELILLRNKEITSTGTPYMNYFQACIRKFIDAPGSLIERLLP